MTPAPSLLAFLLLCGCQCQVDVQSRPADAGVTVDAATEAPKPPPCIREHCFERPERLNCVWNSSINVCGAWLVIYERHCDCVEWGGAP